MAAAAALPSSSSMTARFTVHESATVNRRLGEERSLYGFQRREQEKALRAQKAADAAVYKAQAEAASEGRQRTKGEDQAARRIAARQEHAQRSRRRARAAAKWRESRSQDGSDAAAAASSSRRRASDDAAALLPEILTEDERARIQFIEAQAAELALEEQIFEHRKKERSRHKPPPRPPVALSRPELFRKFELSAEPALARTRAEVETSEALAPHKETAVARCEILRERIKAPETNRGRPTADILKEKMLIAEEAPSAHDGRPAQQQLAAGAALINDLAGKMNKMIQPLGTTATDTFRGAVGGTAPATLLLLNGREAALTPTLRLPLRQPPRKAEKKKITDDNNADDDLPPLVHDDDAPAPTTAAAAAGH